MKGIVIVQRKKDDSLKLLAVVNNFDLSVDLGYYEQKDFIKSTFNENFLDIYRKEYKIPKKNTKIFYID